MSDILYNIYKMYYNIITVNTNVKCIDIVYKYCNIIIYILIYYYLTKSIIITKLYVFI